MQFTGEVMLIRTSYSITKGSDEMCRWWLQPQAQYGAGDRAATAVGLF